MYFTFAWRYFKAKKSANAINVIAWVTVGVIAFATACQILVLSVFNGFEDLVKSLYGAFYADIKIIPAKGKTLTLTAAQLASIKRQPGVSAVSLIAEEKALLQNDDQQSTVYLKGVDDNYTKVTGVAGKTYAGKFNIGTTEAPGLVVGAGIQSAIYLNIDGAMQASILTVILPKKGKISAADPMKSLSEGNVKATGIFAIQQDFDNHYAITNLGFVKQQMDFGDDEYSAVEIKASSNLATLQTQLKSLLGNTYTVQTKFEQNASLYSTMRLEKWAIYAVLTLVLLIAAFNMISALTMLVLEKQKDISVLQSMGADKSMILKIFLSEGLLLGSIGAVSGIVLALIMSFLQVHFKLIPLAGGSFLIDYFPVKLQGTDFIMVSSTVALIAFLASWLPARKAARQAIELR